MWDQRDRKGVFGMLVEDSRERDRLPIRRRNCFVGEC